MIRSMKTPLQFFAFTLFLLYWQPIKPIRAGHGVEEIGYNYRKGSKKGPEHWGDLKKEWKACKDGKLQSPINLSDKHARKAISRVYDLKMSYKPSNATMKNEGHAIAIEWEGDAGSIQINGTDFFLKQCHWHRSSEHFINGRSYDLELHMVHHSRKNNVAVVAFLYKIGRRSPFFSKMNNDVLSLTGIEKEIHLGVIDPRLIRWPSSQFYRYMGSLTTPPCTGGVIWSVNKKVLSVTKEQLRLLERVVYGHAKMNARPLQRLNGRDITLFGPRWGLRN
ncbi:putative carbonic anhydrase [Rosa chinensis]|uniref:Carbonic anhydrase n=1 Tax=Rosa chinensis TaxID=74649 RepID=A0A2P6RB56_ROSCH|nr:alpha carbonic anhydrase 7 [Rosa chinensis]PRQ43644.1 putative carbonic anhydrase [Rosa chinensis]